MSNKECTKCIHKCVCKTAESCDGYVSGCKHFKEKKQGRMDVREKLVELLDRFVDDDWYSSEEIADKLIAHGVTVQEWIPVKDRLPKPFIPVLVYRQSFGTLPPYINVDKMTLWNDDTQVWTDEVGNWKNVTTHWMPLPQPPKGE